MWLRLLLFVVGLFIKSFNFYFCSYWELWSRVLCFLKFQFSRRFPAVVAGVRLLWISTHDLVHGAENSGNRVENSECSHFSNTTSSCLYLAAFISNFLVLGAFQVFITPIYTAGTWQEDRSMCFSPSWKPLAWWCQFRAHDPGGGSTSVLTTSFCSRKIQLFYFN